MTLDNKKRLISFLMKKNFLISPDFVNILNNNFDYENFFSNIAPFIKQKDKPTLLNQKNFYSNLNPKISNNIIQTKIEIIKTYNEKPIKREIQHFVHHFKKRYEALKNILQARNELNDIVSISRVRNMEKNDPVAIIGLISEKQKTKNNHIILTLEDPTAKIKVLINNNNEKLIKMAEDIILDEMIGIVGKMGDNIIFSKDIFFPDVPFSKELKKCSDEVYVAFISDLHVGSNMFLEKEFLNFISWLNCETGNNKQKKLASKIKYLFIIGDLVDGVGIYPGQDSELIIDDIFKQYEACAKFLSMIRKDIKIIVCAGNHDAVRLAEPQPNLDKKYAQPIYDIPNVIVVSNPSYVNIHKTQGFPGFDILMYHGFSFDYYIANVDNIRNNGGYDRADLVMSLLLKKRHLSPTHSSNLYIPDIENDNLVIDKVPDFFVSGHIHKTSISEYRNVTIICGSCWQAKTSFQEKVGHNPEPCRVPIVNLKTREIKLMRFDKVGS
ncbi:MAG: DNA-directed DNA polymerase II small subunit [Nanoarchaeota archaeon]|nr:DNA-directed DNA polymerase II small subunit [Nanoarchaeota archaeon]